MVTGDDVVTGSAIAKQLGIDGEAILGSEFAALDESERLSRIDDIGVVGRVAPEHKVLLVDTLKKKGEVVAMTGDGVNDAPSIKAAHIGITMGSGTEVAKNAGRMILTDDDFATIVHAVEQGRKLYDNLTKYVRFVLISLVAFVLTFLGATLLNIAAGQPFTPAQVLWIHFFVGAPFGVALGLDQETPGLMRRRPRPSSESIITPGVKVTSGLVGLYMAICLDALIFFGKEHYGSTAVASSIGLTAFGLMLVVAAYESRSLTSTTLVREGFDNPRMNWTAVDRDRAGGDGDPDGPLQPAARHHAARRRPVRPGARRGGAAPGALGGGQADRPHAGIGPRFEQTRVSSEAAIAPRDRSRSRKRIFGLPTQFGRGGRPTPSTSTVATGGGSAATRCALGQLRREKWKACEMLDVDRIEGEDEHGTRQTPTQTTFSRTRRSRRRCQEAHGRQERCRAAGQRVAG